MKVIYISTNASDKVGVNATVFTPLEEKNSPLVIFFLLLSKRNRQTIFSEDVVMSC